MRELLYKTLGLPPRYNQNGNLTSDEKTVRRLAYMHGDQELKYILWVRKVRKMLSTYVNIRYDGDLRIRCQYNLMGTSSGRISESSSPTGSGSTLHNLPRTGLEFVYEPEDLQEEGEMDELGILHHYGDKKNKVKLMGIKNMFTAPDGWVFIAPDYKQAEAYVVAYLAEEQKLIDILTSGKDIHREVGGIIFGRPPEKISTDERYLGKRTVHASNYDMGFFRFAEILTIEDVFLQPKETKFLLGKYHSNFPRIKSVYHKEIVNDIVQKRCLVAPNGRKRYFYGAITEETFKSGYSFPPQAVVSDMLNDAFEEIAEYYTLVGQQHDSLWALVKEDEVEKAIEVIYEKMDRPFEIKGKKVRIPIDFQVGKTLGDLEEWKYDPR
jgi:DNA polymerase I-like protein with 3'-5' exonuclease and polymerase domains